MDRLFQTHRIRRNVACGPVWTLTTPDEGGLDHPEKVIVPGVWESHPALRRYRGRGIYEQTFRAGGSVRIWLGGVSFRARVFVDGKELASHYGAYTGFEVTATDLPDGEHLLRVEADNRFGEDSALHIPNDYYSYGGIHRPVVIETVPEVYLAGMHIVPRREEDGWHAVVEITVRSLTDQPVRGLLKVSAAGQEAEQEILISEKGTVYVSMTLFCPGAGEWSPEHPELYFAQAVLEMNGEPADDLIDRFGFREIRVEGRHILLNGRPLRLRGFNRHEEYGAFGLSAPVEAMMQDVQILRDLGANCVRTSHYPNDPRFLDLCDETGLLVWEESHVRGFTEDRMQHPLFMDQLRQSTAEMVEQHFNHPCIFVWGCLNECADDTEYGAVCYRYILGLLRRMDRSRPVTAALLERPGGRVYKDLDIISINLYPQWYHQDSVSEALRNKLLEAEARGGEGKPVIVSEIGAGAIYGYHDPFGEAKWSEERQSSILETQITQVLSLPEVTGVFLWQFADVRVSEEWFMNRPRTYNNKGIVDEYRRPKAAYQTVKRLFHSMK